MANEAGGSGHNEMATEAGGSPQPNQETQPNNNSEGML